MKKLSTLLCLASALTVGLNFPAKAESNLDIEAQPQQLAQTFAGQCRLTNRTTDIFSQPSVAPGVERIAILEPETRVTLGNEVTNGWISVTAPAAGYVIARYLKLCGNNVAIEQPTPEAPTASACRTATIGLVIRPRPIAGSVPVVGSVPADTNVTITGATEQDSVGRTWYKISAPQEGWVSGGVGDNTNFTSCS